MKGCPTDFTRFESAYRALADKLRPMKSMLTRVILNASACVVLCCGQSWAQVTNIPFPSQHTHSGAANSGFPVADGERQIKDAIARAPEMMLSRTEDVGSYIGKTCEAIAKLSDVTLRYRYYRAFIERACATHFETIDSTVPPDRPELNSALYRYDRQQEVEVLRSRAWGCLSRVADQIFAHLLMSQPVPAPCTELFESHFKFIEKMESEERRVGRKRQSLCGSAIDHVEYHFNFVYFKVMDAANAVPDPQDVAAFKARFRQVVGRPIRSAEQYRADARRRTEANIREHRKQEESNRIAAEHQKRCNKEHNIDVK